MAYTAQIILRLDQELTKKMCFSVIFSAAK